MEVEGVMAKKNSIKGVIAGKIETLLEGGSKENSVRGGDPNYQQIWGRGDDEIVRKVAKKDVVKKWELMRICRDVIDENEEMIMNMNVKEMLKENVRWKNEDERNFREWKLRNVRHLSLKETKFKDKENVKVGPFEKFCTKKGLTRERNLWERKCEKEYELKENLVKDLKEERKAARSRRKKIDLTKKCKEILTSTITDWNTTPWREEETLFEELKKIAKKERILIAIGRGENVEETPMKEPEKELLKPRNLRNPEPCLQMCDVHETETLLAAQPSQMPVLKPAAPSRAVYNGQVSNKIFTKPQPVYCGRLTEAEGGPVTSPTSQWEKRVGNRERGGWADSQLEKRDEQTDVQSIQIGLEGKLGELAD